MSRLSYSLVGNKMLTGFLKKVAPGDPHMSEQKEVLGTATLREKHVRCSL